MKTKVLISLLVLFLSACTLPTKIGDIVNDPQGFANREVTVKGTVTESLNLFGISYYKIKDDSGEIMVIPIAAVPNEGAEMKVTGTVTQYFKIGDNELIAIKEKALQ